MAAVKGAEKLMRQLNNLGNVEPTLRSAMNLAVKGVQAQARRYIPNGGNTGELMRSIKTKVEIGEGMLTGTVYTNKKYAAYVEFGTGPVGEANHEGISPEVTPAYSQDGWWFPGDKITPQDAAKYHWPSMTTDDGKILYFTQGQPAYPFMYPALKNQEENIKHLFAEKMCAHIKEV